MLIEVAECSTNGNLAERHGYLIEDFGHARSDQSESFDSLAPRGRTDPAEAELLRSSATSPRCPTEAAGECWGLVELYREHGEALRVKTSCATVPRAGRADADLTITAERAGDRRDVRVEPQQPPTTRAPRSTYL